MRDLLLIIFCFVAGLSVSGVFRLVAGLIGGGDVKPERLAGEYAQVPLLNDEQHAIYESVLSIAGGLGLQVLAKVRLADVIQPMSDGGKYNSQLKLISSRCCDLVVCTARMKVVAVVDLGSSDDSDLLEFLLEDCGIKVVNGKRINANELTSILKTRSLMAK